MKKRTLNILISIVFFAGFLVFTYFVQHYDVQPIGPMGSEVGFASLNKILYDSITPSEILFELTNLLGYFSIFICAVFGTVGFVQLVKTKSLLKVDRDLICLGILYIMAIAAYVIFSFVYINYRPVLEDGALALSYPSSHTVLGICVFGSLIVEIRRRISDPAKALIEEISCWAFLCMIVGCRLLSGWHWTTDIIAGVILSCSLIFAFKAMLPERNHCDAQN